MSIVDQRGRLFGRINLIDLGVLLFVAGLIPIGYGAYVLFHTPPPRLTRVVPNTVVFSRGVELSVQVTGADLRPFLRAKLNAFDAHAFAITTPQLAEVRFSDVPPGIYDVILFDERQEVARLPSGLTILPPPVQVVGWFVGAAPGTNETNGLVPGALFDSTAGSPVELLAVARDRDDRGRHATLRVTCRLSPDGHCSVGGAILAAGSELNLTIPGKSDTFRFRVGELRTDATWIRVNVRLMGLADSLQQVHVGDIDLFGASPVAGVTTGAIVRTLGELRKNQGQFAVTASQSQPGSPVTSVGVLTATMPVDAQAAQLTLPAEPSVTGPRYRDTPLRPGNVMVFEAPSYRLQVLILAIAEPVEQP